MIRLLPIRFLLLVLGFVLSICMATPTKADVGGQVPGPGLCDYPGVGGAGMDFGTYHYWCDFPVEINGSRWHCEYGGAASVGSVGVSILMFNAGISGTLGVLEGSCSFRCPDGSLSAPPNPPGAWKASITPQPCKPIQVQPVDDTVGAIPPDDRYGPAVTNPDNTNPDATQNPHR